MLWCWEGCRAAAEASVVWKSASCVFVDASIASAPSHVWSECLEEASSTRAWTVTHTFTRPFSSRMWWGRHSLSWEASRRGWGGRRTQQEQRSEGADAKNKKGGERASQDLDVLINVRFSNFCWSWLHLLRYFYFNCLKYTRWLPGSRHSQTHEDSLHIWVLTRGSSQVCAFILRSVIFQAVWLTGPLKSDHTKRTSPDMSEDKDKGRVSNLWLSSYLFMFQK